MSENNNNQKAIFSQPPSRFRLFFWPDLKINLNRSRLILRNRKNDSEWLRRETASNKTSENRGPHATERKSRQIFTFFAFVTHWNVRNVIRERVVIRGRTFEVNSSYSDRAHQFHSRSMSISHLRIPSLLLAIASPRKSR